MADLQEKTRLCSVCYKMCRDVCSVAGATRHEADSPHNRGFFAQGIAEGKERLNKEIVDYFFRCSMCKVCREACETGMDTSGIMLAARRDIDEGLLPETVRAVQRAVTAGTYWGKDSAGVVKLVSDLTPRGDLSPALLFWAAASRRRWRLHTGAPFPSWINSGERAASCLESLRPARSPISSDLPRRPNGSGRRSRRQSEESGARTVVVFNADDLRMMQKEFPALGVTMPDIAVVSLPEFLLGLLDEKRPALKTWDGGAVTYHDPCGLGREMRVFEAPRAIIKSAAAGHFREMALTRDKAPAAAGGWDSR